MKLVSKITSILFLILLINPAFPQGYKVSLETPNFKSGLAYLTYYYGKNLNIQDSSIISYSGTAVFHKKEKLEPGIYSIIFPGKKKLVDFLVDKEQNIVVNADTSDLVNKTAITGTKENDLFIQYQKFIASKSKALYESQQAYALAKTKKDSVEQEKIYASLNKELVNYREGIINQYPHSMLAELFSAMREPAVLMQNPHTQEDSISNYYYYKTHYWDGISFMDDRIIRTPFFVPKLERYFREVLVQAPDSIIKEADYLLLFARNNPGMYKFMINWLTDEYINPKYMGQDAVFVHLFEKYHAPGISNWLTQKQQKIISDRAYMLMSNLIGNKAADLKMLDIADKPASLYNVRSPYTLVVFWDPTCSHCKEQIPKIDSFYKAKWKKQGVKVYAVLSENEKAKWISFINEHKLSEWIHVYQPAELKKEEDQKNIANYRQLYDVTQTPTIFLLDKDKRIIAKKLTIPQIDEVLQMKIKNNK